MSAKKNKIYLIAEEYQGKVRFRTHDNSIYGYRAGGNEQQAKFIIEALVKLYGATGGLDIYNKFTEALLHVQHMGEFKKQTACITMYSNESSE